MYDDTPVPSRSISVRVTKRRPCKEIVITGDKDPRGYDNKVTVWLDEKGKLHIRVMKTDLCYKFEKVEEHDGYIEVIAK